jgi:endonuclease-3
MKAPAGWTQIYDLVIELRKEKDAPVDTMGAESIADNTAGVDVARFQVIFQFPIKNSSYDITKQFLHLQD